MWEILIAVIVIFYFFTLPISLCFWSKIEDIEKNFVFYRSYQLIHSVVIFVLLMDSSQSDAYLCPTQLGVSFNWGFSSHQPAVLPEVNQSDEAELENSADDLAL